MTTERYTPKVNRRLDPFAPENLNETNIIVDEYLDSRKAAKKRITRLTTEVEVRVDPNKPFKTVHLGDSHFAHDSADPHAIDDAIANTGSDGLLVTQGNVIEGVSDKFLSTNTIKVAFTLDEQKVIVKSKLKSIDKDGRLIPVGANTCHEGWAGKKATHDPLTEIVSPETPILYTGGQVVFKSSESGEKGEIVLARMELYHNPGKGKTNQSPEGSIRERYREIPNIAGDQISSLDSAHYHQLVAGIDVRHDPVAAEDVSVALGVVGSAKGSKDVPDEFLLGLGVPARSMPGDSGQGLITIWTKDKYKERLNPYPVVGYDRAKVLFDSIEYWDVAKKSGILKELKEAIKVNPITTFPEKKFNINESSKRGKDSSSTSEGRSPIFKKIRHEISTNLPIKIQFLSNLRIGSGTLKRDELMPILKDIKEDDWSYFFALRKLINDDVSKLAGRDYVLENLARMLSQGNGSLIATMLTDNLVKSSWPKDIKKDKEVVSPGLYPGDYLYYDSEIAGVPLIAPETVSKIKVGSQEFILYIKDKLSHFTSLINPFHGLTRVAQIWGINADVLVGGHTEVVGFRTWMRPFGQLEVIVPGGFSEYNEKGPSNRVDYPLGGQGLILFPNRKLLYSFDTADHGKDLHEALWLYEGAQKLGLVKP